MVLVRRLPVRCGVADLLVSVSTTDHRDHPKTQLGRRYYIGNGIMHHDIINIPFYGHPYDTGVVSHPLSISDSYSDPRTSSDHILFLLGELREIQWQRENDGGATDVELIARQDSIDVLNMVRNAWHERHENERREYNKWFTNVDKVASPISIMNAHDYPMCNQSFDDLRTIPEGFEETFHPPKRTSSKPRHATVWDDDGDNYLVSRGYTTVKGDDDQDEHVRSCEPKKTSSKPKPAAIDNYDDEAECRRLRNALQEIGFDI